MAKKTKKEEKIMLIDPQTIRALEIGKKLKWKSGHAVLSLRKIPDEELKAIEKQLATAQPGASMTKKSKKQVKKKRKGRRH